MIIPLAQKFSITFLLLKEKSYVKNTIFFAFQKSKWFKKEFILFLFFEWKIWINNSNKLLIWNNSNNLN
jgi:hypothetical protein